MRPLAPRDDTKALEAKQRRLMQERDRDANGKNTCRMERYIRIHGGKLQGFGWEECGRHPASVDVAHIVRRPECPGLVKYAPEVVISACRECHNAYDGNYLGQNDLRVRVPYKRAKVAWDLVVANSKVRPKAKYDPDQNPDYEDPAA